jgi:hypothetical protein
LKRRKYFSSPMKFSTSTLLKNRWCRSIYCPESFVVLTANRKCFWRAIRRSTRFQLATSLMKYSFKWGRIAPFTTTVILDFTGKRPKCIILHSEIFKKDSWSNQQYSTVALWWSLVSAWCSFCEIISDLQGWETVLIRELL